MRLFRTPFSYASFHDQGHDHDEDLFYAPADD